MDYNWCKSHIMYFALLFLTLLYTILVNLIDQNKAFNRFIPVILFFFVCRKKLVFQEER